ncbi:MAG: hypothetical protein EOO61_02050 [Hymenobacter sp.]|nr:MAG: hypothetical protein EOO61_02050 [Hymenobacter sp.]
MTITAKPHQANTIGDSGNGVHLDTIKISFPQYLLDAYKGDAFIERPNRENKPINEYKRHDTQGVLYISLNGRDCAVQLSSKILGARYPELISSSNILDALNALNATGLLSFDSDKVYENANLLLCHVTQDLRLEQPINEYTNTLKVLHVNTNYDIESYKSGNLTFSKKRITKKRREYLKIYDKGLEYGRHSNGAFHNSLQNDIKKEHQAYFDGITRIEVELKSLNKIREYFALPEGEIKLKTVLASIANPVERMFDSIVGRIIEPMRNSKKESQSSLVQQFAANIDQKELVTFGLCLVYEFDLNAIKHNLQQKSTARGRTTVNTRMKEAGLICKRWQAFAENVEERECSLLHELRNKIAAGTYKHISKESSVQKTVHKKPEMAAL